MAYITELECTLIGEIFQNPKIMHECVQYLTPDMFSDPQCRRVFKECYDLYSEGKEIDPLTVVSKMGNEKEEYKIFTLECYHRVISSSNYLQHIMLIKENALRETIKTECYDIATDYGNSYTMEELEATLSRLVSLFGKNGKSNTYSVPELHKEFLEYMQSKDEYIKTGLPLLDHNLLISRGDYIIVGGRPSSGKTALTAQFALNMSKQYKVVYFSLETSALKLWMRMLSNGTGIELRDLKTKAIMSNCYPKSADAWRKINSFTVNMSENSFLHIEQAAGYTVNQIKSKALQLNADIIFVDYLTLVKDPGKNAYERATKISMDLHTLAQSENITVIALTQLNRNAAGEDKDPTMADIRESGQIEQDADAIMLLSNKRDIDTGDYAKRKLYLVKNKEGETGTNELIFRGDYQRFEEMESEPQ